VAATWVNATWTSVKRSVMSLDDSNLAFDSDKSRGGKGLGLRAAVWIDNAKVPAWNHLSVD
jgi:hypothetical protein